MKKILAIAFLATAMFTSALAFGSVSSHHSVSQPKPTPIRGY